MNKGELVAAMAKSADISKAAAEKALNSLIDSVTKTLKGGKKVTLVGFGTFGTAKRKKRTGRNPRTGSAIVIPARRVPKFSAGAALKSAVK
ncbi:MAG: HU family DNA-binding protein [Candidatus Schekmanbacteria bacterium]|nr:HU family DNA-binding protein [Candidatus Schekmanbacteria bacterium]